MARSKAISYGRLITKNRHNTNILPMLSSRMLPRPTSAYQSRRAFCDFSGNQERPPPPPPPPSSSSPLTSNSTKWTAGIAVTAVISFLQFKEDVDLIMRKGEEILDMVEVVAEAVDMVAEKIDDDLPVGSKLKTTVELVEEVAETIAEKAQKVVDFIDEVQEAEKKLSPVIEPVKQLTQVASTEGS